VSERKIVREYTEHTYVTYMRDKFNAYDSWVESQGVPVLSGSFVHDLRTVELGHWEARQARGAILSFSDQKVADGYVCEIAPGTSMPAHRQLYEEIVVILAGHGSTEVWYEGTAVRSFEWARGSVFSIPINALHRHHNSSGKEPVRYVALTSAPPVIEFFRDHDFLFNNPFAFTDRFDPDDPEFYDKPGKYLTQYYGGMLDTNFISDIRSIKLVPREARGKGNHNMYIHLAGSTMFAHVSQFPVGTYKKAHRHGPGVHIVTLDSTGYTMMWKDGEEPKRYDWAEGSIVCPPAGTWHQHYNTGKEPCRFVALHPSIAVHKGNDGGVEQLEDFDERNLSLLRLYAEECERNGVQVAG
jgi:quercetin dioxygenase-like cupin family protein